VFRTLIISCFVVHTLVVSVLLASVLVAPKLGAETLADPTRPLEYQMPPERKAALQLNSILISQGRRIAIINGVQLSEQQWFDNKQVLQITSSQVTLVSQGRKIVLSLHGKTVRQ